MSSKKVKKIDRGRSSPYEEETKFAKFLNNFANLYGLKQKDIASKTGFSKARVNMWFNSRHTPDPAIIRKVLLDIGAKPTDYEHDLVVDPPVEYRKPLELKRQRILDDCADLLDRADESTVNQLRDIIRTFAIASERNREQLLENTPPNPAELIEAAYDRVRNKAHRATLAKTQAARDSQDSSGNDSDVEPRNVEGGKK